MEPDEIPDAEIDTDESQRIYFREVQHMSRRWLLGVLVGAVATVVVEVFHQVSELRSGILLTVMVLTGVFFYSVRLTTEVREDGIYVRLSPLHRSFRRIGFDEVREVDRQEYSLLEYGGWGLRCSIRGRGVAYTTKGWKGVRVEREEGRSVFVGSQSPDDFVESLEEAMSVEETTS